MIEFKNQELHVSGKIAYENAENYYLNGLKIIQAEKTFPMTVNLSQLEHGSTLALSVLVQWLRHTPNTQGLQFKAVPEKMMKIIQACHLQDDLKLI
ncbi:MULTISPECIES: toluene tolerance protein [Acinetobacter]|uniref:STAS domain-containing protein n=1 Tax=Acinetobacter piscicola TaxID=2006115 RepID=A0A4Q4GWH7_9GAMM|nr:MULTISPECIES: toluene tolerance protein [Acinetobacter]MDM1758340.1 toluene tolerance protein [Acinetobacter sp. 256-1]MDM1760873.1 toluene tolerance protein [Acinetobacter sp. 251-1]QOW44859.1 STAS domain-containing protein [Acinetobacter piscicola]RYL25573.1 toluene tolerance protein [Acinetobacter piscicola]